MLPNRLKIVNFRSIGNIGFELSDLNKVNIIVGRNNTGKSNVIKAIQEVKKAVRSAGTMRSPQFDSLNYHRRDANNLFEFEISINIPANTLISDLESEMGPLTYVFSIGDNHQIKECSYRIQNDTESQRWSKLYSIASRWHRQNYGAMYLDQDRIIKSWNDKVDETYLPLIREAIGEINVIPEFRRISSGESYQMSGENLIETLAVYRDPPVGNEQQIEIFNKIEKFVKSLLHLDSDAKISVTRNDPTIIVENNSIRLPLNSYGTGVHQMVILLTALMSKSGVIFCIEEPEIHLHPQLQREFIDFLIRETNNVYLITTHSPTLINMRGAASDDISRNISTYYLKSDNGSSYGGKIISSSMALDTINDLGLRASDLLQSNCLIWVEGPSDRYYISRWIEILDSSIKEGVDYQFVYTGGSMLSSYEIQNEQDNITQFINILKINQRSIVIADSDKKSKYGKLKPRVERIKQECTKAGILCWVTSGKEIENYVSSAVIMRSHSIEDGDLAFGQFDLLDESIIEFNKSSKIKIPKYSNDKASYSKKYASQFTEDDFRFDLRDRVNEVIQVIRSANGKH